MHCTFHRARPALRVLTYLVLVAAFRVHAAGPGPLAFDEAIDVGEQRSARINAGYAAVSAATEQIPRAAQLPDPKLRLGIDNLPVSNPDAFSLTRDFMTMKRIGYAQDVPNAEKRQARGERAARERDVELTMLAAQRAQVRQDIALAWLELYYAQQTENALARLAESYKLEADTAGPAVSAGRMQPSAVVAAHAAVETVRDRILEQSRNVARARAMLAALVGDAGERPLGAPPNVNVLAHRPDVLADIDAHPAQRVFEQREALAASEVALATSTRNPDWSWEVSFGQREPRFSNMVSVMVSMDLPLFKRDRQNRDVATRVQQLEQARALREDARRMHQGEVRALIAEWTIAGERSQRLEKNLLPLTRERADLTLAAYRGGRGELSAVLESRRGETDVRISQLAAELERARAWARLNYRLHEAHP